MVPSTVGAYRIVRKLGEGGMGEVYEGVHIEIESRVAIKVLRAEVVDRPGALGRFKNEARAVSKIKHPGLIQIFDFGRLPDGSVYMVMEYLQGVSLTARLEQRGGRLFEAETLRLAWQLSDSLAEAHARGIVHRDVKPSNIMLVADRAAVGGERLKLLDFGIAHLGWSELSPQDRATPAGQLLGTPRYMSPEQCRGSTEIDGKADVYSLGVLLYQALAGRPPFQSRSPMDVIALHLMASPDPLTAAAPETSAAVADLIHRMLVKDPEARPSMQDVRSALYALGADEPLPSPRHLPTHKKLVAQAVPAVDPPTPPSPTDQTANQAQGHSEALTRPARLVSAQQPAEDATAPSHQTVDLQTQHRPQPNLAETVRSLERTKRRSVRFWEPLVRPLRISRIRRRVALATAVLLAGVCSTILLVRLSRDSVKGAVPPAPASGANQVVSTAGAATADSAPAVPKAAAEPSSTPPVPEGRGGPAGQKPVNPPPGLSGHPAKKRAKGRGQPAQ